MRLPFIASSWFALHSCFLWKMMFVIWQLKSEVVQGKAESGSSINLLVMPWPSWGNKFRVSCV